MLRLSRAKVINDLELIISRPGPARGQRKWMARGADCSLEKHSYAGDAYSSHIDILRIRIHATPRTVVELLLVSEFWQDGDGHTIHATKWLKQVTGKPKDVYNWISANRD